jgi:hypothetical protein
MGNDEYPKPPIGVSLFLDVLANFADVLRESLRLKAVNHKVRQEGPALGHMYLDRFQGRV